jgi:hypothetical protein
MARPKNPPAKKASGRAPQAEDVAPAEDEGTITPTALTARQQAFLRRASRFLVSIQSPVLVRRAKREGYTAAEHKEGWRLWRLAAGEDRSLDQFLTEQEATGVSAGADGLSLLQPIDDFENTWFPRTRAIIRRVVARDRRDAFAQAFFQDLAQQPLGPSVVGSVGTFLTRVEGLDKSKDPAAKRVRETLSKRGLTDAAITRTRALIAQFETLHGRDKGKSPGQVSAEEIAAAQAAQLEAHESLRDWFNDWGVTLRKVFTVREQVKLGLAVIRRGKVETGEDAEGDDEDGEGDAAEEAPPAGGASAKGKGKDL